MLDKPLRVMWLLNHGAARKFELLMLKAVGITEIFLPKSFPQEIGFRSASVDYSEDANLSIPAEELAILNAQNWYVSPSKEAWDIANKYFDVCFFICHSPGFMNEVARSFTGAAIWRAYGLDRTLSYGEVVKVLIYGSQSVKRLGRRLWFGIAYDHLAKIEPLYLQQREVFLPLGLTNVSVDKNQWKGGDKVIFFVCPDIGFSSYYKQVYEDFKRDMKGFNYKIAGTQPVDVDDPNVLGFVTHEEHERNMSESRLMFYHSSEPNHIHYHPYEAIRVGMPLIFMAGGILDRMGGVGLPGRCVTIAEAREKIRRIMGDDEKLIQHIRQSQTVLLDPMRQENCLGAWRDGFERIKAELAMSRSEHRVSGPRHKKVAVIVPVEYRGGSLRGAKLMAQAIFSGSRAWDEPVDVVLAHLDTAAGYEDEEFQDISDQIQRRSFRWGTVDGGTARRAMRYAGHEGWEPTSNRYIVPDDGIKQMLDCDAWIIISDRVTAPLLPLRPSMFMIYDYLQRYEKAIAGKDQNSINAVRRAQMVMVTTEFTKNDALQYAGVDAKRLVKLPMLAPDFSKDEFDAASVPEPASPYFLWTTNAGPHKNHENAFKALNFYYTNLDGQLDCLVTGTETKNLLKRKDSHLRAAVNFAKNTKVLNERIHWLGELPEYEYRSVLRKSSFLWHAARLDNGTFSVIEAAYMGIPSLSSDYPAMHEIDNQFNLNLTWMSSDNYKEMARKLKEMESSHLSKTAALPNFARLNEQSVDKLAGKYWEVIRECL